MVLHHIAAIFFFSGPLFYVGLLMVIDPTGILTLSEWLVRVFRDVLQRLGGSSSHEIVALDHTQISRRIRLAGVALIVFAIVI